jgi:WD40 repeat protein
MQVWFMCEQGWFFSPHFAYNSNSVHGEPFWQVNDVVVTSNDTLVSCSSDTTLKTWRAYANDGECTRTFRQHSDYVTSLASAHQVRMLYFLV